MNGHRLLEELTAIAIEAAGAICAAGPPEARLKADGSPVTAADEAAEAIILAGLARAAPGVPVVSEESAGTAALPVAASRFFLVDPLDGTREFIAGRVEYTINIALIAEGEPVLGLIAAPALSLIWRGARDGGAERLSFGDGVAGDASAIQIRPLPVAPVALVSRSHADPRTAALLARAPSVRSEPCGSALKFCRIAEGAADLYPRLAPTMPWDVAAGHAILAAAGGSVETPEGAPLRYAAQDTARPLTGFIAAGERKAVRHLLGLDRPA